MPTKYRKKPVVIEAMQLTAENIYEVQSFIEGKSPDISGVIGAEKWYDYKNLVLKEGLRLKTLESDNETQIASIGDFIIKGIEGEFYPIKPEIFKKNLRTRINCQITNNHQSKIIIQKC